MPALPRLYLELAAALLLFLGFAWYRHHLIDYGRTQEQAAVNQAVLATQARLQREYDTKAKLAHQIGEDFAATLTAPVAVPVVRVVRLREHAVCPDHVPEAAQPASGDHGSTASGSTDSVDLGPLVRIGHDADAQVIALQRYITEVCQP
jgi:hypothetical protein